MRKLNLTNRKNRNNKLYLLYLSNQYYFSIVDKSRLMATGIKTGGRTKGTPNRNTTETKELLQKIVSNELDNITDLLEKLEPKERIDAVIKLLPYIVPKQSEVSITEPEPPRKILIKVNRREP